MSARIANLRTTHAYVSNASTLNCIETTISMSDIAQGTATAVLSTDGKRKDSAHATVQNQKKKYKYLKKSMKNLLHSLGIVFKFILS